MARIGSDIVLFRIAEAIASNWQECYHFHRGYENNESFSEDAMNRTFQNALTATIFTAILFVGTPAQTIPRPNAQSPAKGEPARAKTNTADIEDSVAEALTLITDKHVDGGRLPLDDIFKSSFDSMLSALDPHSNYYDAKEAEQFRTNQSSRYFGIGAVIGDLSDPSGKLIGTVVRSTFEGTPANRAGLRYGDLIVEIDGKSMRGKPLAEVRDTLRGPRGTSTTVTVERIETGERRVVEITRDAVSQPSIPEAYMIRPGIGYIAMTGGFNQTTFNEFRQALQSLNSQGMEKLVIDLRNNGGGLVNQAFMIANIFLPRGSTVFSQKGRGDGAANIYRSNNPSPDKTPLFLLVNGATASASEILAGALQDNKRAVVLGEETFGKGLVQNGFPLDYGSLLLLTIAKYQTPSGKLMQKDYSDGGRYTYYRDARGDDPSDAFYFPKRPGGIVPDSEIKSELIPRARLLEQGTLVNPVNNFSVRLIAGGIPGFERYRNAEPTRFGKAFEQNESLVSDELFTTFRRWAIAEFKISGDLIDRERELVIRLLRTELVTATYGSNMSFRVFNDFDRQLLDALDRISK